MAALDRIDRTRPRRAAVPDRRQRRRRQEHADRAAAARHRRRSSPTSSRRSSARRASAARRSTFRCSPTASSPSASRASRSTSPIATSRRRGASSSSPTRPGTSSTRATWSRRHRTAQLAVLLVDARKGVVAQTRRHATLAHLLGIPHLVRRRQQDGPRRLRRGRRSTRITDGRSRVSRAHSASPRRCSTLPLSALDGDMVVERGAHPGWYEGPTLLEHPRDRAGRRRRRPRSRSAFRCSSSRGRRPTTAAATWAASSRARSRVGDRVIVLPSGRTTTVAASHRRRSRARRARTTRHARSRPTSRHRARRHARAKDEAAADAKIVEATLCWLDAAPLDVARTYLLRHTTREVRARVRRASTRLERRHPRGEPRRDARDERHRPRRARLRRADRRRRLRATGDRALHPDRRGDQRHGRRGDDPRPQDTAVASNGRLRTVCLKRLLAFVSARSPPLRRAGRRHAAQRLVRPDARALPGVQRGVREALAGEDRREGHDQAVARRLGQAGARGDRRARSRRRDARARVRHRRDRRAAELHRRRLADAAAATTARRTRRRSCSSCARATRRASRTGTTWSKPGVVGDHAEPEDLGRRALELPRRVGLRAQRKAGDDGKAQGVRRAALQERAGARLRRARRDDHVRRARHRRRAARVGERGVPRASASSARDKFEIVVPSRQHPRRAAGRASSTRSSTSSGTREVAQAYLEFLYTPEGQEIAAQQFLPAARPDGRREVRERSSRKLELFTIDDAFGGWREGADDALRRRRHLRPDLRRSIERRTMRLRPRPQLDRAASTPRAAYPQRRPIA